MTTTLEQERWVPVESYQGDNHLVRVDFVETVDDVVVARDMSSYSFSAQIRRRPGASAVIMSLDVDDSSIGTGIVVFELTAVQSAGLRPGDYRWDAQWSLDGRPLTFAVGSWTVVGQVTR